MTIEALEPLDLDGEALAALLPHRPPILMIDRLLVAADRCSAVGRKLVGADEPCFHTTEQTGSAHYPRALVVESLGQAAAALWLVREAAGLTGAGDEATGPGVLYFAKAEGVTFGQDVRAGQELVHRVRFERAVGRTAFMSGRCTVGDREVASVDSLIAAVR